MSNAGVLPVQLVAADDSRSSFESAARVSHLDPPAA
jgi:hypothetical protein